MRRTTLAAAISLAIVVLAAVIMYTWVPGSIAVILHLVAMLTAGLINDLGLLDLGKWKNGFFISNTSGFVVAGIVHFLLLTILIRLVLPRRTRQPAKTASERVR